jgi:hypothetical protein
MSSMTIDAVAGDCARSISDPSGPIAGPVISVTSCPRLLPLAAEQRVFLRPADDQAGDDVDDFHAG